MSFHVVLVHGTGAPDASWTDPPRSTLCRHLKAAFAEDITFSRPMWSGRNTYQARVDGARTLRQEVLNRAEDGRRIVLVGHSHGGSLIAYALAADEALCRRIAGAIFLATPFVHARPLPLGKHLPKGPALIGGLLCGMIVALSGVFLLATAGWPNERSRALDLVAFALPYTGFAVWWAVSHALERRMGVKDGGVSAETQAQLGALVRQLDLSALEKRGVNDRSLIIRSTADEAASGLATAQFSGRLASDLPSVVWLLPQRLWTRLRRYVGFGGDESPGWAPWAFFSFVLAALVGFALRGAAWLTEWPPLRRLDAAVQALGSSASDAAVAAFAWIAVGVLLVIGVTLPLIVLALPFKLAGLWLYGLRGWPLFKALYIEVSVEPAPPGEWRVHQLDSNLYDREVARVHGQQVQSEVATLAGREPAAQQGAMEAILTSAAIAAAAADDGTTLAHSYVYDDPRAHRAIERWLERVNSPTYGELSRSMATATKVT